ncbi:MAG: ArsR/SmtB family transcription factor [Acidobacteriota bacterium]
MSVTPLDRHVGICKALAHPARVRALGLLRGGELCVCQVIAVLQLAPSTISAHLAELKRAGLVEERKAGRWVYYRLPDGEPEKEIVNRVLAEVGTDPQLRADAKLLAALRKVDLVKLCRVDFDLSRLGVRLPVVAAGERAP